MDTFRYDVENIILEMADIVRENRILREENEKLRKVEKEYSDFIYERARQSEQASHNMVRAALVGIMAGKDDTELTKELLDYM